MTTVDELKIKLIFNSIVKEKRNGEVSFTIGLSKLDEIFEQAKEMEKQQIIDAHENGIVCPPIEYGIDYYNRTYNK